MERSCPEETVVPEVPSSQADLNILGRAGAAASLDKRATHTHVLQSFFGGPCRKGGPPALLWTTY